MMKKIAILGSTGSIGTQTLDVARKNEDLRVVAVSAGKSVEKLEEQIREFKPQAVAVFDLEAASKLRAAVRDLDVKVYSGMEGLCALTELESVDIVLNSVVGMVGLKPTLTALEAKKQMALANKETLVAGGSLVMKTAKESGIEILPVDSEHSAIFQCLAGEWENPVEKILLTASGGPFRTKTMEELAVVTKAQALKHPNWSMGAKITIDSASMMNKGFEMIEAKWLFGVTPEQIQVVVHPQSVIHSMVQFEDGAVIAQLGIPDMKLPISYAFSYPKRLHSKAPRLDFTQYATLTFEEPDMERFRNLAFAFDAVRKGGNMPCILNAANEVVVAAFLRDEIGFLQMSDVIEKTMAKATFISVPTYEDYVATDAEARKIAEQFFN